MQSPILQAIYHRRSIREFTEQEIDSELIYEIIRAGIWAPSGLNNQPWRFVIVRDKDFREQLSRQTHYSHIILGAQALIAVYLDREAMYDEVKDQQAAGACIENMLLAAEALDLGAVWLGQILKNKAEVNKLFKLDERFDLMAVIALGYPLHRQQKSNRKNLNEFILKNI